MSIPENLSITEDELKTANVIFHEISSEEIQGELARGARYVKFAVVRARWACHLILTKNYISPAVAIRDIPDCKPVGGGEIHETEKKDVKLLPSLEEAHWTKPVPKDLMAIIRKRILAYLPEETK